MSNLCTDCGQPLLPSGEKKRPNEYDHASGCPKAMPTKLTAQQERELRRMVVVGPQTSHGTAFVRVHNNLVRAGLARLVEISGITYCAATDEGRARLSPPSSHATKEEP